MGVGHEDEYRDCPFEQFGRQAIVDIVLDLKEVKKHVQGIEIDRAGEIVDIKHMHDDMKEIKDKQEVIIDLLTNKQSIPIAPVDTFKAVVYDIGLWAIKVAIVGGFGLLILDKLGG